MPQHDSPVKIELRLRELAQLFNSLDPSPFLDRDLDVAAEEFIVSWAREVPAQRELELVIRVDTPPTVERRETATKAVRGYFEGRLEIKRRGFRQLMRRGRLSLFIGLAFLALCFGINETVAIFIQGRVGDFLRESLLIGGWVAMWRPLEIFLYDWWPERSEVRLYRRLAQMRITWVE